MSRRTDELYQKILELRAQRLGVSSEEAERVDRPKPLFLLAAEVAAQRLGVSPEQVLATDLQRMETSTYPTPECLTPDEIEDLVETGVEPPSLEVQVAVTAPSAAGVVPLPEVRLAHLRSCDACRTLLAASRPGQWRREEFQRFIDAELPEVAVASGAAGPPSSQAAQQYAEVGMTQENLFERVMAEDEEFRRLRSEFQHYDRELESLKQISPLSPHQQWRISEIKKLKLRAKDRMEAIVRHVRTSATA